MNKKPRRTAWLHAACVLAALSIAPPIASAQSPPANPLGGLTVRVTRAGAPVANATVCIGITNAPNIFNQGTTDNQGNVRFASVPREPFVATANQSGRGTRNSFSPASPSVSVLRINLALPASGGPSCPSTGPDSALTRPRIRDLPVTTSVSPLPAIPIAQTEFCFGAIGAECGQPQADIPGAALCRAGVCFINGGSWDHDQCCFGHRSGMTCDFDPLHQAEAARDQTCVAAWNKAVRLTTKGLSWRRTVDFIRGNSTGVVEFALFCAPANSLVPPEDGNKCCSGQTRALNATEAAAALAARETLRACQ
ncbi:MAG: Ig-like domain-containing protein [Piscinibacter sp.]|uniref:carboxypeptidase-like regulatory domain-containing protein n=1 Tax=Piscinibacter sp. TaxID=1903157 RepID=UPI0011DB49C0|nr:carboxypeptidase-like regulatory domain-containing protein [Piscinibacter sp.]MBP5991125.1 Ig-like domain-containing protein [Piscinibacter sp.]MBP6028337.1 Ig-like domain-containing protein [Piscinibacter sp.]TXH61648.1 MAG: carboxypeptidase regulatory-like domain-containing protein [Burkholderiaceae bacterium]